MAFLPSISGIVSVIFLIGVYIKWPVYVEEGNKLLRNSNYKFKI